MLKKMVRKILGINLILIMIVVNFTFLFNLEVIATLEEGKFVSSEAPYPIQVKKQVDFKNNESAEYIDGFILATDGTLWKVDGGEHTLNVFCNKKFKDIAAGQEFFVALDMEGYLWTWGDNSLCQLGNGTTTSSTSSLVSIMATKTFSSVYANNNTAYAIDNNGYLYAWGDNKFGEALTSNTTVTIKDTYWNYSNEHDCQNIPTKILGDIQFSTLTANENSVIAIDKDGYAWSWGNNEYNQISNGGETQDIKVNHALGSYSYSCYIDEARKMSETEKFSKASLGQNHAILLSISGKVYTIGSNDRGQTGYNAATDVLVSPIGMEEMVIKDIYSIRYSSLFIDSNNRIWGCGANKVGELGNNSKTDSYTVIRINSIDSSLLASSFAGIEGNAGTHLLDTEGNLWSWRATRGVETQSYYPVQVTGRAFEVIFKNGVETVKTETVLVGGSATAPSLTKAGYTLSWDKAFSNVTSDLTVNAVWTANTNTAYKVEHYKQNTSLNGYDLAETENKTGTTDSLAVATKKTYTGFTENTSYSGRVPQGNVAGDGSLVLKLYYDRNSYTVTLNANGGTINAGNVTSYKYGIAQTLPTNVSKTGYTFGGWYVNSDLSGNAVTSIGATETGNKTYYAKWTINKYTVTFKNGSETAKTQTVNYGTAATAPTLTKAGYTLSWDKAFNNVTSNLTVNAVWTANTNTAYKVQHYKQNTSLNGYDLADTENKTGTTDTTVTASKKTYTGFAENTSYSGRKASGIVAGNGSLVLKLYYDRNSYTVTLNANGGTINAGNVTSYTYGIAKTLPTNVSKTGYTFGGWYVNSDLSGNAVTSIGATETGNKTYYAKWNINTYTVTFKDGEKTEKTQTVNYGSGATAPELTKAGYTLSWDKAFNNVTSNLTVNAVWTANTNTAYKVEYYKQNINLNGYELAETENKTAKTDATVTATAKTYEGFTENISYSGRVPQGNVAGDGSLVLKLYYDRNSYTVTLNANGGTINAGNVTSYTYGIAKTLPTNVSKTGYTFGGWYVNSDLSGNAVTSIGTTETGNKTYYAKWTINKYTVTFKNGSETAKTETVEYGKAATAPSLTKAGYTLSWDKAFNNVTSNLTVNAVWTANTNTAYKVEHYKQNTSLSGYTLAETENKTGTTDTTVTASKKTYEGFTENTSYSGRVLSGTLLGDGSLVLKLYYDRNSYTVTLNANGGTINEGNVTSYKYGIAQTLPTNVTKTGHTFGGWFTNNELSGNAVTAVTATDTGNKTYYAKWTINKYTVTFKNGSETAKIETVEYAKAATAPSLIKAGYTLSWDKEFNSVTTDMIVNAVWTANTNTAYKVEHYLRTTDLEVEGYKLEETEELTGTTDTKATAVAKTYKGFTENVEHEERVETGNISGDGSLVLKLYYDRNIYNITYELNGGTASSELTNSYIYGKELVLSNRVIKQGYEFAGWYANSEFTGDVITKIGIEEIGDKEYFAKWTQNEFTVIFKDGEKTQKTQVVKKGESATAPELIKEGHWLSWDKEFENVTSDITVNAIWTINTYTVIFKDGDTISKEQTVNYGSEATAPELTKEGYTLSWDKEFGNITSDIIVNAVWTINTFKVIFKNGDIISKEETVNYGTEATAPELTKAGYTLSWDKEFENVTSDITVNAIWTANTNTVYKVEHYLRNLDREVEGYDLFETEELTGTTDTEATAVPKTYTGFTYDTENSNEIVSGNIVGDGSLVLKLYYSRNSYRITYELNEGIASSELTNSYIYGKGLVLSNRVTKQGHVFAGWYANSEFTGESITTIGKEETGDKTYYAKWIEEEEFYITSEKYSINMEEKQITKVSPKTNIVEFIGNLDTTGNIKIFDLAGEEVSGDTLVGTGYKLQIDFKGTKYEYEIAVRGDLDGNGKISVTDLSILNQIMVKKLTLTGARAKASDLDFSNKTTITDLSMMNQAIVGKITL